jgi:hypothetical protein
MRHCLHPVRDRPFVCRVLPIDIVPVKIRYADTTVVLFWFWFWVCVKTQLTEEQLI